MEERAATEIDRLAQLKVLGHPVPCSAFPWLPRLQSGLPQLARLRRGWQELLQDVSELPPPRPRFVIASRLADDRLWSEALNLGAYNVLAKPFDSKEVFWVVSHAWLDWKRELESLRLLRSAI